MELYYDAHLYFANWGTRQLMLRLNREVLSSDVVEEYCVDESIKAWVAGESVILSFATEDYEGDFDLDVDPLPGLVGVRAELTAGDLRPLYLSWLASLASGEDEPEPEDDELEPPVPPGLTLLTGPRSVLYATFCGSTTTCSTSRPRPLHRYTRPPLTMISFPPGWSGCRWGRRTHSWLGCSGEKVPEYRENCHGACGTNIG